MSVPQALIGKKFGRWTVVGVAQSRANAGVYLSCVCECGSEREVQKYSITKGLSKSCGCLSAEVTASRMKTHGATSMPEYNSWRHMISRCHNEKCDRYKWYGALGVVVCDEWRNSFDAFLAHVGPRPSTAHSIDRIDPSGNYEPGNVRWADSETQARNKRAKPSTGKLGHVGVSTFGSRFRAYASVKNKIKHLGVFDTLDEAVAARRAFEGAR